MPQVELKGVTKDFRIRDRAAERSRLHGFFRPQYALKRAVDDISFSIRQGEMVGYIGPNGAGKSTTIKMLTGILLPTDGEVSVMGMQPWRHRTRLARRIGVVFGQRSQLMWDLPVNDTLSLYQSMYRLPNDLFKRQREMLVELLDIEPFITQAARQLSLGQRMRANLALAFLHGPELVYLDEPTIGLDVLVKDQIRGFLRRVNREMGTTVLLTTHDTQDIEQVTDRLILIDNGAVVFDGTQFAFSERHTAGAYLLEVEFAGESEAVTHPALSLESQEGTRHVYRVDGHSLRHGDAIAMVAQQREIADISVRALSLEAILKKLYAGS